MTSERTALVLGGGGVTGVAWMLGLCSGWRAAGFDPGGADLIVGTSAGSVVAANIATGCDLDELYERQLAGAGEERAASVDMGRWLRMAPTLLRATRSASARAKLGTMALSTPTPSEEERRAVIASRLPVQEWPERRLLITAVDAATGEFRAFDRSGEASLVDAVAASRAVPGVWPPATIAGRRWIDGGMRSATNADLAAGYGRILIVAPIPYGANRFVRRLRRTAEVTVVRPDRNAQRAIGRNPLDLARRPPAARAGREQAASVLPRTW